MTLLFTVASVTSPFSGCRDLVIPGLWSWGSSQPIGTGQKHMCEPIPSKARSWLPAADAHTPVLPCKDSLHPTRGFQKKDSQSKTDTQGGARPHPRQVCTKRTVFLWKRDRENSGMRSEAAGDRAAWRKSDPRICRNGQNIGVLQEAVRGLRALSARGSQARRQGQAWAPRGGWWQVVGASLLPGHPCPAQLRPAAHPSLQESLLALKLARPWRHC